MADPDNAPRPRVLVVDDEPSVRESLRLALRDRYDVRVADGARMALRLVEEEAPEAALLDVRMPEMNGLDLLVQLRAQSPDTAVIMLTADTSPRTVVEAMRRGAEDYLSKPFILDEVRMVVARAIESRALRAEVRRLRSALAERFRYDRLVGRSKAMRAVYETIEQLVDRRSTVLLSGESGTGKEVVARAIHFTGPRAERPFVVVNCAAIPETLIESELFGHERGAFTDARERKLGHFEAADGGTIFLDEIGEVPRPAQARLLRVLQEREFTRVGGTTPVRVDVRVLAATNRDLEQAVKDGSFREDLYYRINVIPIRLPPLRERREDIPLLAAHFLARHADHRPGLGFAPEAMDSLVAYDWPGNVRQLENTIERVAALAPADLVLPEHLPPAIVEGGRVERLRAEVLGGRLPFDDAVAAFERDLLTEALRRAHGVQTRAAEMLGITRRILKYKMDKYGIAE